MTWTLRYSKRAAKDAELLRRGGYGIRIKRLLDILETNPFQNPPPYEKLTGETPERFSRRINAQHRLVYEVLKERKIVSILRMWTHYE